MESQESKNLLLSVFALAMLIITLTGITFAVFYYTANGRVNNYVTSGSINMSYIESNDNVISIENAIPLSDEVGKKQSEYFDFSILSTINGVISINYKLLVSIIPVNNGIENRYIKLYLEKESSGQFKAVSDPVFLSSIVDDRVLYADHFINHENRSRSFITKYRLRMWLDDSYILDEKSRNFKLKINVDAFV